MKQVITTGSSSIAHLFMGDSRLKRVALKIRVPKRPGHESSGYALINELNEKIFSFFCAEKFPIDEELEIEMKFSGHELTYRVVMTHLHEQISSGRIMTGLPTEENPFPARKYYRCFSNVLELKGMEKDGHPVLGESGSAAKAGETAGSNEIPPEAVPSEPVAA
jgi:hypothetical protein